MLGAMIGSQVFRAAPALYVALLTAREQCDGARDECVCGVGGG